MTGDKYNAIMAMIDREFLGDGVTLTLHLTNGDRLSGAGVRLGSLDGSEPPTIAALIDDKTDADPTRGAVFVDVDHIVAVQARLASA